MYVGVYRIELHIPGSRSLKARRSVVQSLKTRLGQLGISVAEIDGQDTWQRASLGASAVSAEPGYLEELAGRIESVCLRETRASLLRVLHDVFPVEL